MTIAESIQQIFVPFEIVERGADQFIVEGYAFVNETVPGEKGISIRRSAMEAATHDYMTWANVREMHTANAAGVALSVDWDQKGAKIRAKIVDPTARMKCEEGVYKGYSIGVLPQVMRGKAVEKLLWYETSLVDRPMDPDAVFSIARRADPPLAEEHLGPALIPETAAVPTAAINLPSGTSIDPGPVTNGATATTAPSPAAEDPGVSRRAMTSTDVPERENLGNGKKEAVCPVCGMPCERCNALPRTHLPIDAAPAAPAILPEEVAVLTRALSAMAETIDEQSKALTRAVERIEALEREPVPVIRPVQYPQALPREFAANDTRVSGREQLEQALENLAGLSDGNAEERAERARQFNLLKNTLFQQS